MNLDNLHKLASEIRLGEWGPIHSILVYQNSQIIFEDYFETYARDVLHEAQSVTKSLQSILVGIAFDQGCLKDLDEPIKDYFSDYQGIDWSEGKDQITIRHLLTMTSGLSWNESQIPYTDILDNDSNRLVLSDDWISYPLQKPMQASPGQVFNYSSAAPILLSHIIALATGMDNEVFAWEYLFDPLQIETYAYQKSPMQPHILGDIDLLPRDMAKLGLLMLNQGRWKGKQILSSQWVKNSIDAHVILDDRAYGFWWWNRTVFSTKIKFEIYYAWGYGGQHIFVIPALQAVVVFTGGFYELTLASEPFRILDNFILPVLV